MASKGLNIKVYNLLTLCNSLTVKHNTISDYLYNLPKETELNK